MIIYTAIICAILIVLAIITPLMSAFFRKPAVSPIEEKEEDAPHPSFSIILAVHDQPDEVERNLPKFLDQQYDGDFQVVVVNKSADDETEDILKRLSQRYSNLYTTFIPESSHYLSRTKLAFTVGIKAAKYEWIIITDIECEPTTDKWLETIAAHCNDSTDMVLGYTNYATDWKAHFWRFERLQTALYCLRRAQRKQAYRYNGRNLAFRKQLFIQHNGFLRNLKYLRGEYDFLVNEYAETGRVAIAAEPEAQLRQTTEPTHREWLNEHLFYMETRKHLRRSASWRCLCNTDTCCLHLALLTQLAGIIYGAIRQDWLVLGAAVFAFILAYALHAIIGSHTARKFGESIPAMLIPWMEWRIVWQHVWHLIRHAHADKYDFIRR